MNNAASHNALYVKRDITSWYQNGSLWDRIVGTNGYDEFEGLFPGCWFNMSKRIICPNSTISHERCSRVLIAGCNSYIEAGEHPSSISGKPSRDQSIGLAYKLNFNHIVCTADYHFGNAKYNDTSATDYLVNSAAYLGSTINTIEIGPVATVGNTAGTINEQLYAEFGNKLITYYRPLPSGMRRDYSNLKNKQPVPKTYEEDTNYMGIVKDIFFTTVQAVLMTENEALGTCSAASSYTCYSSPSCGQLPAFKFNTGDIYKGSDFLLQDIISNSYVAELLHTNNIVATKATSRLLIRPVFVLSPTVGE